MPQAPAEDRGGSSVAATTGRAGSLRWPGADEHHVQHQERSTPGAAELASNQTTASNTTWRQVLPAACRAHQGDAELGWPGRQQRSSLSRSGNAGHRRRNIARPSSACPPAGIVPKTRWMVGRRNKVTSTEPVRRKVLVKVADGTAFPQRPQGEYRDEADDGGGKPRSMAGPPRYDLLDGAAGP